jgi:threonylcarbamoyladenosine tRNA methylthiotransferase MtaB
MGHRAMKSVAFVTVGCKLNQFETEQMREAAEDGGYAAVAPAGKADVYVINTCTVTSKSDYRSRQAVRRALRLNPRATIIVTGCYAQLGAEELARIPGVDAVVGNAQKEHINRYLGLAKQRAPVVEVTDSAGITDLHGTRRLHRFGRYTRAFVKIQDGCDNRCSYCAVPLARGRSRSKSTADIRAEVDVLIGEGYKESVLTGVHLGSYGRDLSAPTSLTDLLEALIPTAGLKRIRLSSIEPTDFTDRLVDLIADPATSICPHVHIPLQSGDDHILHLMGRQYSAAFYADLIARIRKRSPQCGIGADVMVGFPGEDEQAFRNTYDLIADLPVTYLHVFSFSPRYETPAARMKHQVPPAAKKERSALLRQLGREKSVRFRKGLMGKTLDVLVLGTLKEGRSTGLSGNYLRFFLETPAAPNAIVQCRVTDIESTGLKGTALNSESAACR